MRKKLLFFCFAAASLLGYALPVNDDPSGASNNSILLERTPNMSKERSASPAMVGRFSSDFASLTLYSPVDSGEAWVTFSADNCYRVEPVEFVDGSATLYLDLPAGTEYAIQVEFATGACYTGTFRL